MSSGDDYIKVKYECDDNNSNFSNSFGQDEEQCDISHMGELFNIKTAEGGTVPIYLRAGNRLLFGSGKYFYIEQTTAYTDYQKESTGITCICHSCGTRIKGSLKVSSNFICHLKNKHPELYQEFLKQKAEHSAANMRSSKRPNLGGHRSSPYQVPTHMQNNNVQNNEKQEQFNHNVLKFIIATNQSYNIVQDASFIKLFDYTDFPMQMRGPDYYEQVIKDACDYKKLELYHTFNNCRANVCTTIDVWSYAGSNYVAISCHWIDEQYQRQSTMLACKRIKHLDVLVNLQNEILQRNGIPAQSIVASPTGNIQSLQSEFLQFGVLKAVFCQDFNWSCEENIDNLEFIGLDYSHLMKLDTQKLSKIWSQNFVQKLSDNLKAVHKSVMGKCSYFWIASYSKDFQGNFQSILNESIVKPQLFSLVSLYHSLKQMLTHSEKLDHIFCLMQKPGFTPLELKYLAELVEIFEPLNAALAFLDMPQNHYYGCFLPTLVTLKWKLTRLYNSNRFEHLQEALTALKEELLCEFKDYYTLDESKAGAIIAALTYPPVKTRFIAGLKDNAPSFKFEPQQILRKYGADYHIAEEQKSNTHLELNSHNHINNAAAASTSDFFDFGDTTVDAEELRDVNISKKELAELMAELFGDLNEGGVSLESIDVETPRKFISSCQEARLITANTSAKGLEENSELNRHLNFSGQDQMQHDQSESQACAVTSTNITQQDMSFHPDIMSTPSSQINKQQNDDSENVTFIPVAVPNNYQNPECSPGSTVTIPTGNLNSEVEFIALPIPGQPNQFQLARVLNDDNPLTPRKQPLQAPIASTVEELAPKPDVRYDRPYETNYGALYISLKRHAYSEFKEKFDESLKQAQVNQISSTTSETEMADNNVSGFTKYQYDLMQQQMRIHVQMLTQTYVQTYCHPTLWKLAKKPKEMLTELQSKAETNNNFKVWNLDKAIQLTEKWQIELDENTEANKELMAFMHREIELTNHHTRQVPRFHSRIIECFLQSNVFMYPEYLPRMPFSPKLIQFETFSPVESYLIAMGLERHMKIIEENKERIPNKSTPLRVACKRLAKDTIRGKSSRIIWNYIMRFKKADFYNPIKYYFEHGKAPPVEYTPIIGFENSIVLPPKDRVEQLPLVYRKYLEVKNAPPREKKKRRRKPRSRSRVKVSDQFRNSFFDFVREAVGEDITLSENCDEGAQSDAIASVSSNDIEPVITGGTKRKSPKELPKAKRRVPDNLTINVNYVFGAGPITSNHVTPPVQNGTVAVPTPLVWWSGNNSNTFLNGSNNSTQVSVLSQSSQNHSINQSLNSSPSLVGVHPNVTAALEEDTPIINFNYDLATQSLQPALQSSENATEQSQNNQSESELIIDLASSPKDSNVQKTIPNKIQNTPAKKNIQQEQILTNNSPALASSSEDKENQKNNKCTPINPRKRQGKKVRILSSITRFNGNTKKRAVAYREKCRVKQRCEDLINAYGIYLDAFKLLFQYAPIVQRYYLKFKSLELYTNLLRSLKVFCKKHAMAAAGNSPGGVKRSSKASAEDESSPSSQRMARKINRQEENFRQMLLPDTPEEVNRKDSIYAFNFYEKAEEALRSSNRPDDCKKFNSILQTFDPKKDKVSDLYYKLEKLFLPDHPELAQVFLTFILPSDAIEIGKFFEHFMITNMTTFVNKLNIYFSKQPAQIRKIYNCLNELSEDPDLNIKKLENKIVPLLKGNQFLIDWFMQLYPQTPPPERLLSNAENIVNIKDQQTNRTGEYVETLTDLLDSPTNDNQTPHACQLRYINGRIFYGSKIILPAKLSFMAASYKDHNINSEILPPSVPSSTCVHAIKDHGEQRLQSASELTSVTTANESNEDTERSEEDDGSKQLVIDTTAEEDDSCSSIEPGDENTLRAHALRLNPTYYSSACYAANATSTPNLSSNFQGHHPNAKKTALNFNDPDSVASGCGNTGKTSPRKYASQQTIHSPSAHNSTSSVNTKEKRKSPSKKTRSPLNNANARTSVRACNQPMVVIHEASSAIQCANRLKSLVESAESNDEIVDTKEHIKIFARSKACVKNTINFNTSFGPMKNPEDVKQENTDDLEFLPEHPSVTRSPFPSLKMDTDSNEEDGGAVQNANNTEIEANKMVSIAEETINKPTETPKATVLTNAWTRDEDKIILIEMKLGFQNRDELFQRIAEKLQQRSMSEITERHQFLVDFLSKLQRK